MDRVGVRRIALPSLLAVAGVFAGTAWLTSSLTSFYASAVFLAIAGAGTTPLTWTRTINGWFDKQRGLALGLTLSGTGIAAFLAPMYVGWVLSMGSWRTAYLALALIPLLAFPIAWLFLRDPAGGNEKSAATVSAPATGATLSEAYRNYRFWAIGVAFFLVSAGISGSISNLIPLLMDAGRSKASAAGTAGLVGLSVIAGRVIAGILLDRIWGPAVAFVMLAAPALSAWVLAQPVLPDAWVPLAVILLGLAAGAEFDFIAFLTSRYFGLLHYGKIYGLLYASFLAGAALAPPLFARVYDVAGNYSAAFYAASGLFFIGAALLLTLGRYRDEPDGAINS